MNPAAKPCNAFVEELKEMALSLGDKCSYCEVVVAHHARRPAETKDFINSFSSLALSTGLSHSSGRTTDVPKWGSAEYRHAKPFLDRCEQLFTADHVDKKRWPSLLLKAVTDVGESAWIKRHIVDANMEWNDAKVAFTAHFEQHSYNAQLKESYHSCRQKLKERVQKYADRYQNICFQLGYLDDSMFIIDKYINGLEQGIRKKYEEHIFNLTSLSSAQVVQEKCSSLRAVIDITLGLDCLMCIGQDISTVSTQNSGGHGDKYCKWHPNSSNHSTHECKTKGGSANFKKESQSASHSSTSGSNKIVLTKDGKPVICKNCEGNHWPSDKDCPRNTNSNSKVVTRSQSSAASNTNNSQPNNNGSNLSLSAAATGANKSANVNSAVASTTQKAVHFEDSSTQKAVHFEDSSALNARSSMSVLASLSERQVLPKSRSLLIVLNNFIYNCLLDTGATRTCIDEQIVRELGLLLERSVGTIHLAHAGVSMPRLGHVHAAVQFLFPASSRQGLNLTPRVALKCFPLKMIGQITTLLLEWI